VVRSGQDVSVYGFHLEGTHPQLRRIKRPRPYNRRLVIQWIKSTAHPLTTTDPHQQACGHANQVRPRFPVASWNVPLFCVDHDRLGLSNSI